MFIHIQRVLLVGAALRCGLPGPSPQIVQVTQFKLCDSSFAVVRVDEQEAYLALMLSQQTSAALAAPAGKDLKQLPWHHVISLNIMCHPNSGIKSTSGITLYSYTTIKAHLNVSLSLHPTLFYFVKALNPFFHFAVEQSSASGESMTSFCSALNIYQLDLPNIVCGHSWFHTNVSTSSLHPYHIFIVYVMLTVAV